MFLIRENSHFNLLRWLLCYDAVCLINQLSSFSTNLYMIAANIAIITKLLITRVKSNTWKPYMIKYPNPFFDTRNSPTMTPTQLSPTFTFNVDIIVGNVAGKIASLKHCHLVAPKLNNTFW